VGLFGRATLAFTLTACAAPAHAQQVVISSTAPYWKVGAADQTLSRACSLGRFGLADPQRYVARFTGAEGSGVLGIAKGTGLNLRDPDHHARPEEDYFFYGHGTSNCAVFVGGRKPSASAP